MARPYELTLAIEKIRLTLTLVSPDMLKYLELIIHNIECYEERIDNNVKRRKE